MFFRRHQFHSDPFQLFTVHPKSENPCNILWKNVAYWEEIRYSHTKTNLISISRIYLNEFIKYIYFLSEENLWKFSRIIKKIQVKEIFAKKWRFNKATTRHFGNSFYFYEFFRLDDLCVNVRNNTIYFIRWQKNWGFFFSLADTLFRKVSFLYANRLELIENPEKRENGNGVGGGKVTLR